MTVREVGGCLIDLTRRDRQSDQLSAFYPGAQLRDLKFAGIEVEAPTMYEAAELDRVFVQARRVTLRLVAAPREKAPDVEVAYSLEDGWPYMLVTTTFANRGDTAVDAELMDSIRADRTFEYEPRRGGRPFWIYDKHFGQAYGVVADGHDILGASARQLLLRYQDRDRKGRRPACARRDVPADPAGDPRGEPLRRSARRRSAGREARSPRSPCGEGHGGTSRPPRPTSSSPTTASRMPGAAPTSKELC